MVKESMDITDIIKPYEEKPEEEYSDMKSKTSPFDFISAVSETKKDIIAENPEIEKDYNTYITNRGFGYFSDSVLYANEMNINSHIPGVAQYYYYMSSLRKRKRRSPWYKLNKSEDQILVENVYNVRPEIAKQYLKVLKDDDLKKLREITETGGNKKNK
jgi:hypothetical protein